LRATTPILVVTAAALLFASSAGAATPVFKGTVGPGFTISMAKKPKKPGKITLTISDKASSHNFHLRGPGGKNVAAFDVKAKKNVKSVATSVGSTGTTSFTFTLKKGSYTFVCDPHASSMKGSFTVK
jgi:plastocyanin